MIKTLGLFLAFGLALSLHAENADKTQPTILLTGFEPFGHSTFNTSWNVVKTFEGQEIAGCKIKTLQLKVVYDAVEKPLAEALEKWQPVIVISFGEGTAKISLERVAHNGYSPAKPLDNAGKPPPREKIDPEGPDELKSSLFLDSISKKLDAAGIPYTLSDDAGGYLCNECFYRLMKLKEHKGACGFVHLPVVQPTDEKAMQRLQAAVKIMVEQSAKIHEAIKSIR